MDQAIAGNKYAVMHRHMPTQRCAVGKNDMISHGGIVPDVATGHEQAVRADHGVFLHLVGAIHRHVFAEHIAVANADPRRFTSILQVLRLIANHTACVETVPRPDCRLAGEVDVRPDDTLGAQGHMFIDDRIRPDRRRRVDLSFRMNDSGGMNHE